MPMHTIFRLRNPALLMALAAVYPVFSYGAGRIDFASGNVTAVNAAGVQRPLTKGNEIGNGDTIRTGEGARAQVRFDDGGMVSLQPQTDFRVDNYQYSGKQDGSEKGFFSLIKGGMRTITGLIGRTNRDAYKVNTSVATIGIRGTEYTAAMGDGVLHVNTGEGLVEVCNGAGCILLASGESGIVSGGNASPKKTDSKPQLPPAQPSSAEIPVYATGETKSASGAVAPVSTPLASGSGNYVAYTGTKGGFATYGLETSNTNAQIDPASALMTGFTDSFGAAYGSGLVAGAFSVDGVIGWGRWTSGLYNSSTSLKDFHYVVGTPTPSADLTALAGITATYQLAGFTLPTSDTGLTGGAPTATFTAQFGGTGSLSLALSVPIGGAVYSDTLTGGYGGATINLSSASSSATGFFAGSNASHAAMTYKMDTGGMAVFGALGFKR